MRNTLIILFCLLSNIIGATTYYISPTGSDSNSGSSSSPWKTLAYACSKVTTPGDVIHVSAGKYTETSQGVLAVGVSVEGEGRSNTFITSNITDANAGTLYLASGTENTNGNQHISGIYFDGNNMTTYCAIWVRARGNVEISNCTFINYAKYGVRFHGEVSGKSPSTSVNYATGNSFHDNIATNNAYYEHGIGGGANVMITCQTGFLCYNNTISQSRATYTNGCGVKTEGWTRGFKIYNNTITCDINSDKNVTDSWDFAIECWGDVGSVSEGIEIYGNTLYNGEIDLAGRVTQKGSYAFGASIHDNYIGGSSFPTVNKIGIILEANTSLSDILIYKNHFKWVTEGIVNYCTLGSVLYNNISIYYNIFEEIGRNANGATQGLAISSRSVSGGTGFKVSNWHIYNNVFAASTRANCTQGVAIDLENQSSNTYSNIEIKNNIITGFEGGAFYNGTSGTIDNLSIQNNIFTACGKSNAPVLNTTPTNYTCNGNLTSDPLFVSASDFHLQSSSPAVGKGMSVSGVTVDYEGKSIKNPPSIGAYESGTTTQTPVQVIPVYQSSAVANATPTLLELTYDSSLGTIVPAASAFNVLVNSTARTVTNVAISGTKVQLTLASAIKYGDVVTVTYTKPATNSLQSTTGGLAASISGKPVTNNLASSTKDATTLTVTMAVSTHVHNIINVILTYSTTPTATNAPNAIQITDLTGKLLVQKLIDTGGTNILIPLNLAKGIYNIMTAGGTAQIVTKRFRVF